jgi:hypothetical protein
MTKRFVVSVGVFFGAALIFIVATRPTQPSTQLSAAPTPPPTANNIRSGQDTSTASNAMSPASFPTTPHTAPSNPQCAEGQRLITIPTSSEFTVDETAFCTKLNVGPTFASPNGKWTAAIESIPGTDIEGRLQYQLPAGPRLWEADHNLFILFTNRLTGEQKEFGIAPAILQGDVVSIAEGQERMESDLADWSSDGKDLWGWATFSTNANPGAGDVSAAPLWASFFKIDTTTWLAESHLVPVSTDHLEVSVSPKLSDVLNSDGDIALYGEMMGSSTLSLDSYNFATRTTTTIASFPGDFRAAGCDPSSISAPFCQTETYMLKAHWIDSSTVSWVNPQTGQTVVRSVL